MHLRSIGVHVYLQYAYSSNGFGTLMVLGLTLCAKNMNLQYDICRDALLVYFDLFGPSGHYMQGK